MNKENIQTLIEHHLAVKLYEKAERDSESGNNIKPSFEKYLPHGFPLELIEVMKKWKVISKSPYSYSFYDITNKGWDDSDNDKFYRISDHWNFKTKYDTRIHCKLDKNVPDKWWTLAKYDKASGTYKMIKTLPNRTALEMFAPGSLPAPELYKDITVTTANQLKKALGGGDKRAEISALLHAGIFKAVNYDDIQKGFVVPAAVKREISTLGIKEGVVLYKVKK